MSKELFKSLVENNNIKAFILRSFGAGDPNSNLFDAVKIISQQIEQKRTEAELQKTHKEQEETVKESAEDDTTPPSQENQESVIIENVINGRLYIYVLLDIERIEINITHGYINNINSGFYPRKTLEDWIYGIVTYQ